MAEIDHGAARAFARKVVRIGKKPEAVQLARAYLALTETLTDAFGSMAAERRDLRARLRGVLARIDALIEGEPKKESLRAELTGSKTAARHAVEQLRKDREPWRPGQAMPTVVDMAGHALIHDGAEYAVVGDRASNSSHGNARWHVRFEACGHVAIVEGILIRAQESKGKPVLCPECRKAATGG